MTLNEWKKECHSLAVEKGWWDTPRNFGEVCMLITSEVSELFEALRSGKLDQPCDKPISLSCFEEEVADIFIRLADFCGSACIDLERAVKIKHEYNKTRPYRHGNKSA